MNLCVLYTSSYARDDNPRERFINSCARYNNPCARYNNPLSRNNNPFARYNIPCARNNKLSVQFNNSCKRNKNPCARYNKPYARDNNPFSRYNYLSAQLNNLRQLSGVFFWCNNKWAKWPCIAHLSLCLLVYVSVGKWQSPLLTYTYFWQIIFVYRPPKTISTKRFGILMNNLIDLSYMTTCRSPVGQNKEEYKDQESIHDAA